MVSVLYLSFYTRHFLSAVGDSVKFFCYVDDIVKMYKNAIFNPRPSKFKIFGLVTKSPAHTGLIGVQDI
jgi:hypothetical protein